MEPNVEDTLHLNTHWGIISMTTKSKNSGIQSETRSMWSQDHRVTDKNQISGINIHRESIEWIYSRHFPKCRETNRFSNPRGF